MEVRFGKWRTVVLLPLFGLVLKFPRFYWRGLTDAWHIVMSWRRHGWSFAKQQADPNNLTGGIIRHLIGGLHDNWQEFRFYQATHHPFVQPTYFSLFGWCNIQRLGEPLAMNRDSLKFQLRTITNGAVDQDLRHFSNPGNFCVDDGHLRMVSYGSSTVRKIIVQHGQHILDQFDPTWHRETV